MAQDLTAAKVQKTVADAIFPFEPGSVEVWTEPEYFGVGHKLTVKVGNVPQPCIYVIGADALYIQSQDELLAAFYDVIWHHYRYRPSLPVEDHIILGEE